jgi:uncharacterized protein YciI
MKNGIQIVSLIFLLFYGIYGCAPEEQECIDEPFTQDVAEGYDSTLAQKLGADDYGMRQYVMAFLKTGPNRDQDSASRADLQRAHLDNIMKMADEGKLVVAGPFMDNSDIRGIYIFNVSTVEEAEKLTKTDPAVKAGSLVMELHPWYGPAALMETNNISKKVSKKAI